MTIRFTGYETVRQRDERNPQGRDCKSDDKTSNDNDYEGIVQIMKSIEDIIPIAKRSEMQGFSHSQKEYRKHNRFFGFNISVTGDPQI